MPSQQAQAPPPRPGAPAALARRALLGGAWLGLSALVHGAGGLLLIVLVNRTRADAEVEVAVAAVALALIFMNGLLFEGPLGAAFKQRRDLSPGGAAGLARVQIVAGLAGSVAALGLAAPIARLFERLPAERLADLLRLASPCVALAAFAGARKALLERELAFRRVAAVELACALAALVLGAALAPRYGAGALVGAAIARLALEACILGVVSPLPARARASIPWPEVRGHLRFAGAMAAQAATLAARMAEPLLFGLVLGPLVAIYHVAKSLADLPVSRLMALVMRAGFSTFARAQDDSERLLRGLRRLQAGTALAVFPVLCGLAALAPRILWLVLGEPYAEHLGEAVLALRVLCAAGLVLGYAFGLAAVLNAVGAARAMARTQAFGTALMLGALVLGGLAGGLEGAVIARGAAGAAAGALVLRLAATHLRFGLAEVARSVRRALPAALGAWLLAAWLGVLASDLWPSSAPGAGAARPVLAVLALQALLGAASYAVALLALGARPAEAKAWLRASP